jgi:hypothetical protein
MFIRLALYLPNAVTEKENMKCGNILLTMSILGGKGISRLQVIYHLKAYLRMVLTGKNV